MMIGTTNKANRVNWLKKKLHNLPAGWRLLDAGAGELANKKFCDHLEYVSQDFCQYGGTGDKKGLQMGTWDTKHIDIISDISNIPEEDAAFNVILCSEVFEHLPDPVKVFKEFYRLLTPGGQLILTAPFCSLTHFAPYHFSTGFNSYFYEHHLVNQGFEIEELMRNGSYFEYLAQEMRRVGSTASRYSCEQPTFIERQALKVCLKMLERFNQRDEGSGELLCFGYNVVAQKEK